MNSVLGAIVSTPDVKQSLACTCMTRGIAMDIRSSGSVGIVDEY